MSTQSPVEVAAQAEAPVVAEPKKVSKPVEEQQAEAAPVAPAVEAVASEGEQAAQAPVVQAPVEQPKPELSRADFLQIVDEFGADIAAQTVKDGGDYAAALKLAYGKRGERIALLEKQCSEMKAARAGSPVPVEDVTKLEKASLFKTGK